MKTVDPLHGVAAYPDNRLIAERVRAFVAFIARKARSEPDLSAERASASL